MGPLNSNHNHLLSAAAGLSQVQTVAVDFLFPNFPVKVLKSYRGFFFLNAVTLRPIVRSAPPATCDAPH